MFRMIAAGAASLAAGVFWGFLASVGAKYAIGLSDNMSIVAVGIPVAAILVVFFWRKLPEKF